MGRPTALGSARRTSRVPRARSRSRCASPPPTSYPHAEAQGDGRAARPRAGRGVPLEEAQHRRASWSGGVADRGRRGSYCSGGEGRGRTTSGWAGEPRPAMVRILRAGAKQGEQREPLLYRVETLPRAARRGWAGDSSATHELLPGAGRDRGKPGRPPPGHPQCENRVLTLWVTGRRPTQIDLMLHTHSGR